MKTEIPIFTTKEMEIEIDKERKELIDKFEEYEFTNILRKFRCHNPNECMDMIKDGFKNQLQKLKEKSK